MPEHNPHQPGCTCRCGLPPQTIININVDLTPVLLKLDLMEAHIMATLDDLTAVTTEIQTGLAAVQTDVDRVLELLTTMGTLPPDQQAQLDTAVAALTGVSQALGAMDAQIDAVSPDPAPAPEPQV